MLDQDQERDGGENGWMVVIKTCRDVIMLSACEKEWEIILNCAERRKVQSTKLHQFDIVSPDTENMTSHYFGLCQNTKT